MHPHSLTILSPHLHTPSETSTASPHNEDKPAAKKGVADSLYIISLAGGAQQEPQRYSSAKSIDICPYSRLHQEAERGKVGQMEKKGKKMEGRRWALMSSPVILSQSFSLSFHFLLYSFFFFVMSYISVFFLLSSSSFFFFMCPTALSLSISFSFRFFLFCLSPLNISTVSVSFLSSSISSSYFSPLTLLSFHFHSITSAFLPFSYTASPP